MKPEPVATVVVCSLCGRSWDAHGDKPTKDDCIALLKAELAKPRGYTLTSGGTASGAAMYLVGQSGSETFMSPNQARAIEATRGEIHPRRRRDGDDPPDMGVPAKVS